MNIAYTRISTDKQDQINQEHLILQYCQRHAIHLDEIIKIEMSTRKSEELRGIDKLKMLLKNGDALIVSELSRLGRKMIDVLNLVKFFANKGVKVIFINQPELSLVNGAMRDFMVAAYGYFAETEREFISLRTKAGLEAAKSKGKKLGRPKGAQGKSTLVEPYREFIEEMLQNHLSLSSIQKLINKSISDKNEKIKYTTLKYYVDTHIARKEQL